MWARCPMASRQAIYRTLTIRCWHTAVPLASAGLGNLRVGLSALNIAGLGVLCRDRGFRARAPSLGLLALGLKRRQRPLAGATRSQYFATMRDAMLVASKRACATRRSSYRSDAYGLRRQSRVYARNGCSIGHWGLTRRRARLEHWRGGRLSRTLTETTVAIGFGHRPRPTLRSAGLDV